MNRILVDGFLLHLSKPSALLISEGNIKKERKQHLGLPATHLFLMFILLVRAFVRLVASTALVLRPTLSAAEADGGICPLDIYQLFGGIISFILYIYYIIDFIFLQIIFIYDF